MPYLAQVGAILAKIETTPGVEAAPDPEDDFILASDAQYTPDFTLIDRNYMRPSISRNPHLMGRQLATLTFTTEVFGTGTAALDTDTTTQAAATPKWADLLVGCAMVGAVVETPPGKVYSPVTGGQKTLTIYCYYDGILHKLTGAMGTWSMSAEAGQIATISWSFTGVYSAPTAATTPTVQITNVVPALVESCSFVIGGTASTVLVPANISVDMQNTVIPRADANSAKGFNSTIITSRQPTITFNPEQVPEASHPFWGDFAGATGKAVSFAIGATNGNRMLVNVPNMVISGLQYADRDGIRIYEVSGGCSTTYGAGDDEVTLKFV